MSRLALLATALCAACASETPRDSRANDGLPVVHDERLELTLLASDPAIATPIGIAVDAKDRIFVLESHTHLEGSGYQGPKGDRIRVFIDADRKGEADSTYLFAEGFEDGMNLAFSPTGELYLVTAKAVWALHDRNGDGVSDGRTAVLRLTEPAKVYDHAALLGIAFAPDGSMYLSRGNTGGSAWTLVGTDGSSVSGFGDGGNIVKARPDGSHLEEFATGFWNAFALTVDPEGRLLAVDNDPDSRGPNRLVHVVAGGDYGYRTLYGGSGIHPYLAWNGELPGTLPYAAPLGEAPSGILDASRAAFPAEYRGAMLVTVWEESNIVSVPLSPRGASVHGTPRVIIQGGNDFHPVAFATDSRGTVYFTDWKVRAYPNHGQGRIWRLRARNGSGTATSPANGANAAGPSPEVRTLTELAEVRSADGIPRVRSALLSADPFVRHAAMMALARPELTAPREAALRDPDAAVRLGAVLALARAGGAGSETLARRLLSDPDERVRQATLIWVGRTGMTGLRRELDAAIGIGSPSTTLFEVYLATVAQLEPAFLRAFRAGSGAAKDIGQPLPPRFIERFVATPTHPVELRALAISYLEKPSEQIPLLTRLARPSSPMAIRLEAVRSLAALSDTAAGAALLAVLSDPGSPPELRSEALVGLAGHSVVASDRALALLDDAEADVRLEAARYLRSRPIDAATAAALRRKGSSPEGETNAPVREQIELALARGATVSGRPATAEDWTRVLADGGDATRGRRVFHSRQSTCVQCHVVERRGGSLGPDLSGVGRSKTRAQIIQSILRPSAEISPEFQGWYVRTRDGKTHYGRQIDVGEKGAELYTLDGRLTSFRDIAGYGPAEKSLMPDGLESRFTPSELRDLLAYLERTR